ncbi:MAG: tRNA preQ1(34) S-adenosylmethionine ribosyltransferase-isomerase QueA [Deltaproteobacteria bacterium]|nr:MAG: tRNA preQ1(34) S-adenosylmethionine ribosyltransferase-isomerase QueA [Deltaproteobacteria bacterium]
MFSINDYDYELPVDLIAQKPSDKRDNSRLFHFNREDKAFSHLKFKDILGLIGKDDLFVVNNTKVVPARLFGKKETGGKVEIFILDYLGGLESYIKTGNFQCDCLLKSSRRPKIGSIIIIDDDFYAKIISMKGKHVSICFTGRGDILRKIDELGNLPLPPYIKRGKNNNFAYDKLRYQTVYAKKNGAVAAPTAGLHFTEELIDEIRKKGADFAEITLYVGYGTFSSVECEDIRKHRIHRESYHIGSHQAEKINKSIESGKRIIAVGTTSVRTLEFAADEKGFVRSGKGTCDLFIYPGYKFKVVNGLITNFHLPKSTLIMLVSAFSDIKTIKSAYLEAVEKKYRFYSYGDAMFIE